MMRHGAHALFIPGPTNLPHRVRTAMDIPLEDHRAPDYPDFVLPLLADVKRVFRTERGAVLLYPASGTGGWDAAIANTLSPGDRVLTSVHGQFSALWAEACRRHGLVVDAIEAEWGEAAPLEIIAARLAADREHAIRAVLVCHNETATGVTSDVAGVRAALAAAGHPALLFVDGVSSIASIDFRMDEWGVDIAVSGSQKGFMLPPGLALIGVSEKALTAGETAKFPRAFFDFSAMLAANRTGYFPYTPPTTLLRGLRAALDMLFEEGLDNVHARHRRLAEGVRRAVAAWGLRQCARRPEIASDTVTAAVVPDGFDADEVLRIAYGRYGLSLGAGLARVKGRLFRIGHLGWVNELMLLQALAGCEMAMRDAGLDVAPGVGIAAAQEHYRAAAPGAIMAAAAK